MRSCMHALLKFKLGDVGALECACEGILMQRVLLHAAGTTYVINRFSAPDIISEYCPRNCNAIARDRAQFL